MLRVGVAICLFLPCGMNCVIISSMNTCNRASHFHAEVCCRREHGLFRQVILVAEQRLMYV